MKKSTATNIFIALIYLGIWQLIYMVIRQEILIVSPLAVLKKIIYLLQTPEYYISIYHSLTRVMQGFILAIIIGILLSVLSYKSKLIHRFISPGLNIIKSVPVASFIILALVWLPRRQLTSFISFLMVLPLIWKNTLEGLKSTDKQLLQMAEIFHLSNYKKIKHIYIPAVKPNLHAAITTGLGFAWKSGIAAEVIATPSLTIGTMLYNSKVYLETSDLFAWTITIIILSFAMEKIIVKIINYLMVKE